MRQLALMVVMSLSIVPVLGQTKPAPKGPSKPTYDPYQQYEHEFDSQVEAVNIVMETYSNTDCTDTTFPETAHKYITEYNKLLDIFKRRPDKEKHSIRVRQNELFTGLTVISDTIDEMQNECIQKAHQQTPVQPNNNSTT
jgi:hypothetical protein